MAKRFLLAAAVVLSAPSAPVVYGQLPAGTWQYQWGDDFSGNTLDTTKWLSGEPGWANSSQSLANPDGSLVAIGGGELTLTAIRNSVGFGYEKNWNGGVISTYPYGSYGLQTPLFAPGSSAIFFEARIKLPTTPGSWPAFWGLDPNAPTGNELDIMEYPLTFPGGSGYADNQYHTAYHYSNYSGAGGGQVTTGGALNTTYHVFSALWDRPAQTLRWYLDGAQVKSYTNVTVDQMDDIYAILNYAVGGNPDTWIGRPTVGDWGVAWTDETKVDWIRVWRLAAAKTSNWNYTGTATDVNWDDAANWTNGSPNLAGVTSTFNSVATAAEQHLDWGGRRTTSVINLDGSTKYRIGWADDRLVLAWGNNGGLKPAINVAATSTAAHTIESTLEIAGGLDINNDSAQPLTFFEPILGDGGININGPGVVIFDGNNTYGGNTIIDSDAAGPGIARVRGQNSFGLGGTVIIGQAGNATTARMELENNSLVSNNITFSGRNNSSVGIQSLSGNNTISGTISANVGGGTYAIQSDAGMLTLSGAASGATASGVALQAAASGSRVFTLQGAGDGIVSGKIQNGSGIVGITKEGSGTWTLSGANTHTGATNVNAGTLGFTSAQSNIDSVAVADGASLRVRAAGASSTTLTSSSLSLGSSTLTLDFNSFDTTAPLIATTGAFNANGTVSVALQNAGVLSTGLHTLVSYSSFGGGGTLPGGVLPVGPRGTGMLVNAGNTLSLDVLTNDRPIWTGDVSGEWSTATLGAPKNWKLQSNSAQTDFLEGDNVLFDDSATGATSVTINSGNVTPVAVTFDNSTKNYTVSGSNGIAGSGWLTKTGTGTVTINTANTFTGAVTVDGGTLYANPGNAANNRAFSYASGITVNSGATLRSGPNGLFGWDGTQEKTMTVNAGGTLTADGGLTSDVGVGTVILNGGTLATLAGGATDWGSWRFDDPTDKLLVTESSTVSAQNVKFGNASAAIEVAAGKTLNFTGTITDATSGGISYLNKTGDGTLVLAGANGYSGGTTINAGTVSISANNNLGANGSGVTLDGGTLKTTALIQNTNHRITVLDGGGTINVSNNVQYWIDSIAYLQGYGPLAVTGDGTLTENKGNLRLSKINDGYSGVLTVKDGGSLEFGADQAVSTFATLIVANQGEVAVNNGLTLPNAITVTGNTNSVLSFINGNTGVFSGPITVNAGANLTVGLRDWYNYSNTRSGTISGVISGSGGLTVASGTGGGGTLTLSAINTFSGGTTVNGGALSLTAGGANGTIRGALTINAGASVQLNAVDSLGYAAGARVTQININGGTLNNAVAGNNSASANWVLTGGTMTSTGGGTFHIGYEGANSITTNASATQSTISGNVVLRSGNTPTITVADGAAATDLLISGGISDNAFGEGSAGITKTGAGTLMLSGSNTYTGATTVNAGTLLLSGSGSTGTGTTTVSSSATLGGDGTVQGDLVVQSGGTVAPGLSPGILNVNGNAGFNGDAALSIELGGTVKGQDLLAVSGTMTLSGSNQLQLAFLGESDPGNLITSGTYTILNSSMLTGTFASATDLGVYDDGGGVTYTANSVNLVLTLDLLGGDADLNGITNGLDLNILGGNWLGSGNWNGGDFNGDGVVNGLDLNILGGKWLMSATVSGSGGGSGGTVSAIPEPGSGAFLFLGGAALISRRRRAKGQT